MTAKEAIEILHPDTTARTLLRIEYSGYGDLNGKQAMKEAVDDACLMACEALEKLDAAVNAITEAADDICQTVTTARKLNEDCINANFDVLTATVRDGIESVKTTIRKGQK